MRNGGVWKASQHRHPWWGPKSLERVRNNGSVNARVMRSAQSRYGHRGIRVGEASNPGPGVKRRRRVVDSSKSVSGSDTEIDPDSTMLDDLERESQVPGVLVGARAGRSSRRLVLIGGSQDTTGRGTIKCGSAPRARGCRPLRWIQRGRG